MVSLLPADDEKVVEASASLIQQDRLVPFSVKMADCFFMWRTMIQLCLPRWLPALQCCQASGQSLERPSPSCPTGHVQLYLELE